MAFDCPENQVVFRTWERQVNEPERRGSTECIWSIPMPQEGWSGAEMSEHMSSQGDKPSSGKRHSLRAGEVEKPCLVWVLGGSILDALLYMHMSARGVCSSPCRALPFIVQERGWTLAHEGKQHHQSSFLLSAVVEIIPQIPGEDCWTVIGGLWQLCCLLHTTQPGFVHPGLRALCPLREGVSNPVHPGLVPSAGAQRYGSGPLCCLGKISPQGPWANAALQR